jgi:DNA-binding Lrp family transcriptional regulator
LDAKDYRLLVRLSTHTTESLSQLSNATHLDRKTIKQRIDKLYAGNIIQKFRYGINIFKIGHLVYLLKLDVLWGEKQQLLPHLRADNYAGFIFETLTGYVMYYMPPSHKELFLFTSKIQSLSPSTHVDVIQTTDIFRIELVPQSAIRIFQQRAGLRQATSSSRRGARGSHAASRNHRTP